MACWMDVKVWRLEAECGVVVGECKASPCDADRGRQRLWRDVTSQTMACMGTYPSIFCKAAASY